MIQRASLWSFWCNDCNHWVANLPTNIEQTEGDFLNRVSDGENTISFLDAVRIKNFNTILDLLVSYKGKKGRILDIGCANGLFLRQAITRGYTACGIEPNKKMAGAAMRYRLDIRIGYFPTALGANEKFDVIIFNDVLEHIPDIRAALKACSAHLSSDGILVLNVPSAKGLLFNLARALLLIKVTGPWERLWQTMFFTPHLHYFSPNSLEKLAQECGFQLNGPLARLKTIAVDGLWERIIANPQASWFRKINEFLGVLLVLPLLGVSPADSIVGFFSIGTLPISTSYTETHSGLDIAGTTRSSC